MNNPRMYLIDDLTTTELAGCRDGFGEGLVNLGKTNSKVVVLCGDLTESTRSQAFAETYPGRFFEAGVAEQNMMGVAAGLALNGKIPFVNSYAVFSPGRNWDQLRVSICYSNLNVKIVGAHAGISVGPDGATHQALEDLAITRVLPNLIVVAPADKAQTFKATLAIAEHPGPAYIRFGRNQTPAFTTHMTPFKLGEAQLLREGRDLTIFACGPLVYQALSAAVELETEADVEVINVHTLKPLDRKTIIKSAQKTKRVLTVEEHQISGGLGGAIAELLSETAPTLMKRIGMADCFGESGQPEELLAKYGMDKQAIVGAVRDLIKA